MHGGGGNGAPSVNHLLNKLIMFVRPANYFGATLELENCGFKILSGMYEVTDFIWAWRFFLDLLRNPLINRSQGVVDGAIRR
jgi:hypothetical protein